MIRILLVDDHPAMRAGLDSVFRSEPGLIPLGAASGEYDLWPLLERTKPDVVLVDYHLPGSDGLILCRRLKARVPAPKVIVYSAYAGAGMAVPAFLCGADGLVHKSVQARELYDAVRTVAGGDTVLPALSSALVQEAAARIDERDLPVFGMLLDRTPAREIAQVMGMAPETLTHRIEGMISRLGVEVPRPGAEGPGDGSTSIRPDPAAGGPRTMRRPRRHREPS